MKKLKTLNDNLLVNKTKSLVSGEREILVELLDYLNEIDRRDLYLKLGYSSMFAFAVGKLKYSESQAYKRIKAARCINEYPETREMLAEAKLNLCTIVLAYKELSAENKEELLNKLSGTSKRKAEKILASDKPITKAPDKIKAIGKVDKSSESLAIFTCPGASSENSKLEEQEVLHEIKFQAADEFVEKLEEVKSLLSGKFPRGASLEEVFSECMEAYLDKHSPIRREKRRAKRKLRSVKTNTNTRHIPASVRDEVFIRDNHQCAYTSDDGIRCECKHNLHIDHIKPFALGGRSEFDNLRLLCGPHNRMEAKRVFGESYIQSRIKAA